MTTLSVWKMLLLLPLLLLQLQSPSLLLQQLLPLIWKVTPFCNRQQQQGQPYCGSEMSSYPSSMPQHLAYLLLLLLLLLLPVLLLTK